MVKKIVIFVLVFVVILVGLHFAFYAFINTKGKDIIIGGIEKNLGAEATMSSLSVKFPFNLEIKDFKCQDLSFKKANVSLGLFNPFARKLSLSKVYIDGLNIKVVKDSQGVYIEPFIVKKGNGGFMETNESAVTKKAEGESSEEGAAEAQTTASAEGKVSVGEKGIETSKRFSFGIGKLHLKDSKGELSYFHKDKGPIDIVFEDVELTVKNFIYPQLSRFSLDFVAAVKTDQGIGKNSLYAKGWVDYQKKNMDLDFNIKSMDYYTFQQYYPSFWKPENLGIKEAVLSLDSSLISENNDLVIDGVLSLDKIHFTEQEEEFPRRDLIKTAIALLQGNKEKPTLHFKLRTKMDSPDLNLSALKGSFAESIPSFPGIIIKEMIGKTAESIPDAVKEAGGVAGDAADTAVEAIKGVVDSITNIFKPSQEENLPKNP